MLWKSGILSLGICLIRSNCWKYIEILFAAMSLSSDGMVTGRERVIPMVSLPMIATHSLRVKLNTCLHHCSVPSNPILGSGKFFAFSLGFPLQSFRPYLILIGISLALLVCPLMRRKRMAEIRSHWK